MIPDQSGVISLALRCCLWAEERRRRLWESFAWEDLLISDWLPEETDKTSSLDNSSLSGAQGYTNSLCVTEASIMSHYAVRVTFLSSVVYRDKKRLSGLTDHGHLINTAVFTLRNLQLCVAWRFRTLGLSSFSPCFTNQNIYATLYYAVSSIVLL